MRQMTRVGLLLSILCTAASAQTASQEFEGHTFALQLPAGYKLAGQANQGPAMKTLGYATDPRADGTRGLIQITLINFVSSSKEREPSLAEFAAVMVNGVRQRRTEWKEAARPVELNGAAATRIEWSGSAAPPERALIMHGVMIVGIKDHMGYSLHTQDVEPFAETTTVKAEQALMTFTLQAKR